MTSTLKFLLFLVGFVWILSPEKVSAQAIRNLGLADKWMDEAVTAMESRDYKRANTIFRNLIDSGLPLPEEMPYYFAVTLFEIGQFNNSSNFLNKYLELNGFKAQYYPLATALLDRLKGPLAEIQACPYCDPSGYRYQECPTCHGHEQSEQTCSYCRGVGVVGCSRCMGTGMVTVKNIFNILEYYECERCENTGRLECPTCQGSKMEISVCQTCKGKGQVPSSLICTHVEHQDQELVKD